ncbi:MAG: head-tail connector protein [Dichotomicrobium sp.]
MNRLKVVTAPELPPVPLADAKAHLRVDSDDEDDLITSLVGAATDHAESFMGRAVVARTLDYFLDAFPDDDGPIRPPMPPLIEVDGVFYTDSDGDEQEFTNFEIDTASEPGRIYLVPSVSWPSGVRDSANAVRVRYSAGHVLTEGSPPSLASEVPPDIRAAILLMVGTLYEQRESIAVGVSVAMLPWGAEQLLRRKRVEISAA